MIVAVAICGGCQVTRSGAGAQFTASDEWTRSYPLAQGGEVEITGGPGTIDIRGGPGATVDVSAERIAHAPSQAAADALVPRIRIREDITPAKVVLETQGLAGLVIGVNVAVNYHISVPASATIRARTANGTVTASQVSGSVALTSANGAVVGRDLAGAVEARAVNGSVSIDLARIGQDPVELRATNGSVDLALPAAANANIAANITNGTISTGNLKLDLLGEQTKRRLRARLNAGGTPIEITAVNGTIKIRPRQ